MRAFASDRVSRREGRGFEGSGASPVAGVFLSGWAECQELGLRGCRDGIGRAVEPDEAEAQHLSVVETLRWFALGVLVFWCRGCVLSRWTLTGCGGLCAPGVRGANGVRRRFRLRERVASHQTGISECGCKLSGVGFFDNG